MGWLKDWGLGALESEQERLVGVGGGTLEWHRDGCIGSWRSALSVVDQ